MYEHITTSLRSGKLIQPHVVSTTDVLGIVGELFHRSFTDLSELKNNLVTDLVVWDFSEDGSIEHVRKLLHEVAKRSQGDYQVFVLLSLDSLTEQASNALLKTFEDISAYSLFLMTCKNPHSLLPTIRSRIVVMSYDAPQSQEYDELQNEVQNFLGGSYFPLLSRILGNTIDRSQCSEVLHCLQLAVKDGSISKSTDIARISTALERTSTSNATAKYQVDTVLFQFLAGKKS